MVVDTLPLVVDGEKIDDENECSRVRAASPISS